jgi:hypothetical protein
MRRQRRFTGLGRLLGLALVVQLLVPSGLWHSFVDHEDSHHCIAQVEDVAVGIKHIHCLALELSLPMADQSDDFLFEPLPFKVCLMGVLSVTDTHFRHDFSRFLRGPPSRFV